ncbi:MAG: BlaB/IND/MUS family subclass B1 metallo-beta-lactamase [Chitinophagaceae bacterium]
MRIYPAILLLSLSFSLLGQPQTTKLKIAHLTGDFYVYTTYGDPGDGSLFPSNSMYLVTSAGVVLFDTPWDTTQFQPLLDSIEFKHHKAAVICISTHFHNDKTAGLAYFRQKGIKTFTTALTDSLSKLADQNSAQYLISKDSLFAVGQYQFQTFYPGKGHSPDNIVLWFEEDKILYGGCFIKSTETNSIGNLSDANIPEWIISIGKVQRKFPAPRFVIPGHQDFTSTQSVSHTLTILKNYKPANSH